MKGNFFFCINKHHIGVVHVPSFHLSARSSSFFCAFFFTLMVNLFMDHPIPNIAYESAPKKVGLRLAFSFCCFAVLHDAGIGHPLRFNEYEGVDEDSGDVDIASAISFWSWNRRFCLAMTDSFLISKEISSILTNGLRILFDAVRLSWNPGSIMSLPRSPRKSERNRSVFFADMPVSALAFLTVESETRHRFANPLCTVDLRVIFQHCGDNRSSVIRL